MQRKVIIIIGVQTECSAPMETPVRSLVSFFNYFFILLLYINISNLSVCWLVWDIVAHHVLLSHAAAVEIYRNQYQTTQGGIIGITLNCGMLFYLFFIFFIFIFFYINFSTMKIMRNHTLPLRMMRLQQNGA
jgi:hypothetical protein